MASSSSSNARPTRVERSPESFESLQRRNQAAEILQSYEKLSWLSYARRESLQQTRLHFQNVVAGFSAADEHALVDWPVDNTPVPKRAADDADKSSRRKYAGNVSKGKERAVKGGGDGEGGGGGAVLTGSSSTLPANPGGDGRGKAAQSTASSSSKKRKS